MNSGESAETVSATAAPTPPNTRAGGQDDGTYTNSLKLMELYHHGSQGGSFGVLLVPWFAGAARNLFFAGELTD